MTHAVVTGAGGFIGGHLVRRLLADGHTVRGVDVKPLDEWFLRAEGAENVVGDLRGIDACRAAVEGVDEVYNLAADMGGMGFIENNKAACMLSVLVSTHMLVAARDAEVSRFFYASSACVYAADKQTSTDHVALVESDAYPATPEDGYGWEKLFTERMCRHFREDYGLETRIGRYHNVYGPIGTYKGGREKAPAAICRKVAVAARTGGTTIDIWGDGEQVRSFMYVDDCVEGTLKLMHSDVVEPLNIGSSESVTINQLVDLAESFEGLQLEREYDLSAPKGVRGRSSDNSKVLELLGWEPRTSLRDGLRETYRWVAEQVERDLAEGERAAAA